ncbi:MAG: 2-C-methyl-D-erythritol 4-phosphate cytidylyltransferase [Lachnospiraceae bacterium]|nr:2-C-methyl-D-erythritol 4-phosphate cytidylyltransferase [Lachnospiraceae bacterium]
MNAAILLSGGTGRRMSLDTPKQYLKAAGRMIVTHAAMPLFLFPIIDRVVFVMEEDYREEVFRELKEEKADLGKLLGIARPGSNRQESIRQGLLKLRESCGEPEDADTVLIHDAARPLLSEELLIRLYEGLTGHEGVMPVLPMKDTVYLGDGEKRIASLLNRDRVFAGQAPELFLLRPYAKAVLGLDPETLEKIRGSSEPAVMAGMDVVMTEGEESNFKITTPEDLKRFRELMERTD